ncbi:MAG: DUF4157 domain-containing protein [Myxococcales bacterium]|nr:DUF4157 domain-containing protein [Myxococcales bacterium]
MRRYRAVVVGDEVWIELVIAIAGAGSAGPTGRGRRALEVPTAVAKPRPDAPVGRAWAVAHRLRLPGPCSIVATRRRDPVGAAGSWSGPAPGKRTLTADLPAPGWRGGAPRGGQLPSPSTGAPLPAAIAQAAGAEFGHDFSAVRVHHDGAAEQLGTQAFARGDDLHFASGAFQPDAQAGRALIGHELAHVAQQRDGRVEATGEACGTPVNTDAALEAEADRRGDAFADVVQGFDIDELLAMPAPRAPAARARQWPRAPTCRPRRIAITTANRTRSPCPSGRAWASAGPGAERENHWGLPEPLLTRMGGDLPLVDVTTGTTTIKLATPFGSSSLGSDGKFKITIRTATSPPAPTDEGRGRRQGGAGVRRSRQHRQVSGAARSARSPSPPTPAARRRSAPPGSRWSTTATPARSPPRSRPS